MPFGIKFESVYIRRNTSDILYLYNLLAPNLGSRFSPKTQLLLESKRFLFCGLKIELYVHVCGKIVQKTKLDDLIPTTFLPVENNFI